MLALVVCTLSARGQAPPPEAPSGATFRVNRDPFMRSHTYAWLALDSFNPNKQFGVAIIHKPGGCSGTLQSCPCWYFSSNGGLDFPDQALFIPLGMPAGFDQTSDPTCSFDRQPDPNNDCGYYSYLMINSAFRTNGLPESIVQLQRAEPGGPGNPPWLWLTPNSTTVFAPASYSVIPRPQGEPIDSRYAVDKPFLAIDQNPYSPFWNNIYVACVYWVPWWFEESHPERTVGNYIYCRVGSSANSPPGNYAWTASFTNPPVYTFPTSPGGLRVDDDPLPPLERPEHLKLDAPYLTIASNGTIYCAWLRWENGDPGAWIMMDRSSNGGTTPSWGPDQQIHRINQRMRLINRMGPGGDQTWVNSFPKISVDPFNPNLVHLVWAEIIGSRSDIFYMPVTWTPLGAQPGGVIQVNDPNRDAGDLWDYHPTVGVDDQGTKHVLWYSQRGAGDVDRFHLYHAERRVGATLQGFGGIVTRFDHKVSTCVSSNQGWLLVYRENYDPFDPWPTGSEPHLGNYVAGPAANFQPDATLPADVALFPFWIHMEPNEPNRNSEVMATPLAVTSLQMASPTSHVIGINQTVTFNLVAGPVNAGRTFQLWSTPSGVDPGVLLPGNGTNPLCSSRSLQLGSAGCASGRDSAAQSRRTSSCRLRRSGRCRKPDRSVRDPAKLGRIHSMVRVLLAPGWVIRFQLRFKPGGDVPELVDFGRGDSETLVARAKRE